MTIGRLDTDVCKQLRYETQSLLELPVTYPTLLNRLWTRQQPVYLLEIGRGRTVSERDESDYARLQSYARHLAGNT